MNILVADNDIKLRRLVSSRLEARGYKVFEESNSELVLKALKDQTLDLILLSTEMERVNGRLLIEIIRKTPHLGPIPVIMMTEENDIAELILSQQRGFDDFLIKPFDPLVLQLRVSMNIDRARKRTEANALTQLPGNPTIERVIRERIEKEEKFSVVYIDINDFKSFNDRYGFKKGDDVIRHTAHMLAKITAEKDPKNGFVGHVGGDDFVVVLDPELEESFARDFIHEFDRVMPTYYNDEDQSQGKIRTKNRKGEEQDFPLMSCSVAACTNLYRPYHNLGEIAQDAAALKSFLKSQPGSQYLRDRRAAPAEDLNEALRVLKENVEEKGKKQKVDPLGKTLLRAGLITEEQLQIALQKNMETGKRLGEVLISMNLVKSEDVGKMLQEKLNVPYISLRHYVPPRDMLRLFSRDFMKARRVVPIASTEEGVKLAMCDPFDLRTLDAIERISELKPIPHLALEDEFDEFVERYLEESEDSGERIG